MDDGRVSYKKAVEAIRQFGYLGIERNEDVVILYADDIPYASVKNTNYPLRTWDYECHDWITLENCRTIDDVVWHFNNGVCTLNEARAWCLVNNYPQSELSRRNEDGHSSPAMRHQKKEPWPYRLVAFLNEVIDMILDDILEDFV